MTKVLDGVSLAAMLRNGYNNLLRNVELINDLNVFPVPDGDTGTNMAMTFGGGVKAAQETEEAGTYLSAFQRGTLLSARGNSGVILSQFFHGFAAALSQCPEVSLSDFSKAVEQGMKDAYAAVIHPTEGTILTLIRVGADYLRKESFESFEDCLPALVDCLKKTLARTPDLLPVLKEAGVVDSGGAGLLCIFEGMEAYLQGQTIEADSAADASLISPAVMGEFGPDSVLEYGYCTEFILQLMNAKTDITAFDLQPMIDYFQSIGDSLVAVKNGDVVKIHVHTFSPDQVIAYARQYGEFVSFKMENMSVQHSEVVSKQTKPKEKFAVVAVTSGSGFEEYFKEIGVKVTVSGGQTQNPAAEDFLRAFKEANAEYIVVLPNNSNIVLTAQQAAGLYKESDVRVIPTKSLAEGYSALSMMDPYCDTIEELLDSMTGFMGNITTGLVTTATRDTLMNGISVKEGNYIGLAESKICSAAQTPADAALQMLAALSDIEDKQVITVFYGKDVTETGLRDLQHRLEEEYPLIETGYIFGGQEVYCLIMAIE